ncbi:MAG: NAD(P)/FAD-dependent oxidoreductase, partial [Myxococcota bacterium]|nr:NAD(P)/FAD-dependent oxidoreductase [Myxococcota bacterium]
MTQILEADYLVVGSGAMGMAFTDVLMTESDASVVMIDRQHQPGGHWNVAYPFVRLHQPSAFYGVNSRALGSGHVDETGWNRGLAELATSGEVCAYFDQVMQQQFLPSGRVQYFPLCEYEGGRRFRSRVGAGEYEVRCEKVVDATYMNVSVPSMRPPPFPVAEGAHCEALNALPRIGPDFERFVVVGAGKTGMDACLFLLKNGVDPDRIRWIMPRDSWLLDRAQIQPGKAGEEVVTRLFAEQLDVIAASETKEELFERLDAAGMLLRLDPAVTPTMYRCATVTKLELEQLRRIEGVIRKGRVTAIEPGRIVLEEGEVSTDPKTLHVDCTADGLATRPVVPVFDGDRITLQSLRVCQQVFSAAFIGHIECGGADEATRNEICSPLPHPDTDIDFLRTTLQNGANQARWSQDPELVAWLYASRLAGEAVEA